MENAMCAFTARTTRTHISRLPFYPTSIAPVIFAGPLATFPILDYLRHVGQRHSLSVTPTAIAAVTRGLWLCIRMTHYPIMPLNLNDDLS